jgi:hypothetical protein
MTRALTAHADRHPHEDEYRDARRMGGVDQQE